jgi:PadR family transcriptional regulator PadR
MTRKTLGEFEQLVLLACLHLGTEAYAVPIIAEIQARTGRRVSHGHVYVALRRLEKRGFVTSELADPTPERGGRAKRYFRVRPDAVARLREARDDLLKMWQGLETAPK